MNNRMKLTATENRPAPRRSAVRSSQRKHDLLAILMMLLSLLLLLSIVSYSSKDEAVADIKFSHVVKVIMGDRSIQPNRDLAKNWLGLSGALIANFFINSTIGYFSLVFPLLLFTWGLGMLRRKSYRRLIYFSNYILIAAVLLATLIGLFRLIPWLPQLGPEWSGSIGDFLAHALSGLLGITGGLIVVLTAILIVFVLSVDLDLRVTFVRLRDFFKVIARWIGEKWIDRREVQLQRERERTIERQEKMITNEDWEARGKENVLIGKPEPVIKKPISKERDELIPGWEEALKPRRSKETEPQQQLEELQTPLKRFSYQVGAPPNAVPKTVPLAARETVAEKETALPARDSVIENLEDYIPPSSELLDLPTRGDTVDDEELRENAELLRDKLAKFDIEIDDISVTPGPVVTLYELVPASSVRISKIVSLADDIALALQAKGIRILAPIPGKGAVGVEIPNHHPSIVNIRSVINSAMFREAKSDLPLAMGKTITGEIYCDDLAKMPHLLIAGATGSGKSVGINTILMSLLFKLHPSDVKFVIIDPKKIELSLYAQLRNHFLAVSPDVDEEIFTTPGNAVLILKSVEYEMEQRYDKLAKAGVRNVTDYNERIRSGKLRMSPPSAQKVSSGSGTVTAEATFQKIPYLIVVIDELADLMLTAAKEVEEPIARLAQLARAVGIHLVVATQRPSVDVITGVIKANFSARIAYQVASKIDSRTILDVNGAEQLLGNGDMLYLPSGSPKPIRIQNAFISTDEVERVVHHVGRQPGYSRPYELPSILNRKRAGYAGGEHGERDELFEEAARLIVRHQQGSVSLLQRRLKVGYSRAARLVDELEAAGIVGPFDGSKAREVLTEDEEALEAILQGIGDGVEE